MMRSFPLPLQPTAPGVVKPPRRRNVKLEDLLLVQTVALTASSVSKPKRSGGADPVSKTSTPTRAPSATVAVISHAPVCAGADPTMPSLEHNLPTELLATVPKHIPQYFTELVCYWFSRYDRAVFLEYAASAPHKLCLWKCAQMWRDYEFYWPEVFGGSAWRDADINDITSFNAAPVEEYEAVAIVVTMVNRYFTYLAERDTYNRRYFLASDGEAWE